jgi:hypothetical protein
MRQGTTARPVGDQTERAIESGREGTPARRPGRRSQARDSGPRWLSEPKVAIWVALALAIAIGGGRKLLLAWRARKAVALLGEPGVTPEQIRAVTEYGRAGIWELMRIFSTAQSEPQRAAAGVALARLWHLDQLVAEEEQAVVRRGFAVTWHARRRYPRALQAAIPITVTYGVPLLRDDGRHVGPANLEWSVRVLGARRAAVEEFSPWTAGPGRVTFTMVPGDFESNGPHRLVLQTRVRTAGLTDAWEIEPPQIAFTFEFDPILQLDAILTLADSTRDESVARAIRLEPSAAADGQPATYLSLSDAWTLRNPPRIAVTTPLPCDLAHAIWIELEGVSGRFPGGRLTVSGQGTPRAGSSGADSVTRTFELGPIPPLPANVIERPGARRLRIVLEADPDVGWADPDVRSIWPGRAETGWVEVEIVRR